MQCKVGCYIVLLLCPAHIDKSWRKVAPSLSIRRSSGLRESTRTAQVVGAVEDEAVGEEVEVVTGEEGAAEVDAGAGEVDEVDTMVAAVEARSLVETSSTTWDGIGTSTW